MHPNIHFVPLPSLPVQPLISADVQDVMDKALQGLPIITPVTVSPPSSPMLNDREATAAMPKRLGASGGSAAQNTSPHLNHRHQHLHSHSNHDHDHDHDHQLTPPQEAGSGSNPAPVVKWQPLWMVRYNVVDTKRSIVDSIGYVINAEYTC